MFKNFSEFPGKFLEIYRIFRKFPFPGNENFREIINPTRDYFCRLSFFSGLKRYYYDPKLGKCLAFTYNGCLGNLNRFASLSDCENHCIYSSEKKGGKSDVTAGIVIGIIVLGVVIIVGLLALKYYYIIRGNNENYRIFQNANEPRTSSISHLQSYENPTFQLENTSS